MKFTRIDVDGAWLLEQERRGDDRGFFARIWCEDELSQHGLEIRIAQINTGFSPRRATLRGMHFQREPHSEVKIARCTRGSVFDVVVDLRPSSPTYKHWQGFRLTPDNGLALYVPEGCAHGYLTLEDNSELEYTTSSRYHPSAASGVRYDDGAFGIQWPRAIEVISQADAKWDDFSE